MSELRDLVQRVLERAEGDEQIEVYVSRGTDTDVEVYEGVIETLTTASSAGVGIRVLRRGEAGSRVGASWAGSLDDAAVDQALTEARDNVRFATPDEFVDFARPDGVAPPELELTAPGVLATPLDAKIEMALELERVVRAGDPRIRQVERAAYSDFVAEAALGSTTGVTAESARTGAYLSVEAIAADSSGDQTGWGLTVGREPGALDPAAAARDAIERATRRLGAVRPTSQRVSVVLDPRTAASFLAIIGGALSGDAVVRGRSFFAGRLGEDVAAGAVTLVDDPGDPRHFAAALYDAEGLASRRNVLIEGGVLRQFVYDTVSARRAGATSTGSAVRGGVAGSPSAGVRALALAPGDLEPDAIYRQIGEGLLVDSFTGVHSGVNPVSGDFSVGVTGLMIRGGQLAEPVREATIASTLQRMLLDVVAVGCDVTWLPGVAAGQSLALSEVALAGA